MDTVTMTPSMHPSARVQVKRTIKGASAILLPFHASGAPDWDGFRAHVARTAAAGLTPAINMDTGYANLIDEPTRVTALRLARETLNGGHFIAGAFVGDAPGAAFDLAAYLRAIRQIEDYGGLPIVFQSYGLTGAGDAAAIDHYAQIAAHTARFLAFELGTMFVPFGRIYALDTFTDLLAIPQCIGAKHSSLRRDLEWERLAVRDQVRPDFTVYTGNDLAIDMVMYGSDYLLGLSTFAPEAFARRDAYWAAGDAAFYELNDLLQYLGFFAFRLPVPAYKHSAAQFLHVRGLIGHDATHPESPTRPESDRAILQDIAARLDTLMGAGR